MSDKGHLQKADIITIVEEYLSRRLGLSNPTLKDSAINKHANITCKLSNCQTFIGYDLSFAKTAVKNLGNAEAVHELDTTNQLIIATTYTPKRRPVHTHNSNQTEHDNTITIKTAEELEDADNDNKEVTDE